VPPYRENNEISVNAMEKHKEGNLRVRFAEPTKLLPEVILENKDLLRMPKSVKETSHLTVKFKEPYTPTREGQARLTVGSFHKKVDARLTP